MMASLHRLAVSYVFYHPLLEFPSLSCKRRRTSRLESTGFAERRLSRQLRIIALREPEVDQSSHGQPVKMSNLSTVERLIAISQQMNHQSKAK
jgi:hypothetical protein